MLIKSLFCVSALLVVGQEKQLVPDARPLPQFRNVNIPAVERWIDEIADAISDRNLKQMWRNTAPSTLDTTLHWHNFDNPACPLEGASGDECDLAFIITGDIPAMWIRDSTNQITHYADLIKGDESGAIAKLFLGTIHMQAYYLLEYVWGNAFKSPEWTGHNSGDNLWSHSDWVKPAYDEKLVWEAKFEVDSWAAFLRLIVVFWENATDEQRLRLWDGVVVDTLIEMYNAATAMQAGTKDADWTAPYKFQRSGTAPSETQFVGGEGNIAKRTGMIRSPFRPSDDATVLPFLVPSNMMFARALKDVAAIVRVSNVTVNLGYLEQMADQVFDGLEKYAIVGTKDCTLAEVETDEDCKHYVFEVDGFGGITDMDDSNVPNLVSAPLFNFVDMDDPVYRRTRVRSLHSDTNPWYFKNETTGIEGVGSPHTGLKRVWPMAVATQALTTKDRAEIEKCLTVLLDMQAGTGLMHEGVHVDNPRDYTRQWFAWANSVFAQVILYLHKTPELKPILQEYVYTPKVPI